VDVDWVHLTQYGHEWRAVVNAVMNLRISLKSENVILGSETEGYLNDTRLLLRLFRSFVRGAVLLGKVKGHVMSA
jgi:hypothetical protein